jgi:hypothetical protein
MMLHCAIEENQQEVAAIKQNNSYRASNLIRYQ